MHMCAREDRDVASHFQKHNQPPPLASILRRPQDGHLLALPWARVTREIPFRDWAVRDWLWTRLGATGADARKTTDFAGLVSQNRFPSKHRRRRQQVPTSEPEARISWKAILRHLLARDFEQLLGHPRIDLQENSPRADRRPPKTTPDPHFDGQRLAGRSWRLPSGVYHFAGATTQCGRTHHSRTSRAWPKPV